MKARRLFAIAAFWAFEVTAQDTVSTEPHEPATAVSTAEFQEVKYQVLQLQVEASATRPSEPKAITFYLGSSAPSLKVLHATITVDGQMIAEQDVDDRAFHSLGGPGRLLRVGNRSLADGPHLFHAAVIVETTVPEGSGMQNIEADDTFDTSQGIRSVSFNLEPSRVVGVPHIAFKRYRAEPRAESWAVRTIRKIGSLWQIDGPYVPGEAGDPTVAYAEYLRHSGKPDQAAVELLSLVANPNARNGLSPQYWLRTAAVLREAGVWNYGRAICDQLDASRQEPQAVAVERLNIALMDYDVGNVDQAEQQLLAVKSRIPDDRLQDWQLAYAKILFTRNQYAEAERVLQDRDDEGTQAYRYMSQSEDAIFTTAVRHYNLAVAMVHNGEEQRGLSLLDLIGRMKTASKDLIAIRDQANLALGWHFLRKKQGITAMGALGRVGMKGRCSEPALLGMGWAQLAPAGEKIQRMRLDREAVSTLVQLPSPLKHSLTELGVFDPELDNTGGPASFERGEPPQDHQAGLRRALTFWQELAKRDKRLASVEEGLLAIAYAHQGLDDESAARQAYELAIAVLEEKRKGLQGEAAAVQDAGLSTLINQARDSNDKVTLLGSGYLGPSEQNRAIFSAAQRYRDLEALARTVHELVERSEAESLSSPIGAGAQAVDLAARISSVQQIELNRVQTLALQELNLLAGVNEQYLQTAYFAAARASDQALALQAH